MGPQPVRFRTPGHDLPSNAMSTDRRVRRTQLALTTALVELMLEKGFESVTVAEIADRADVGRSTFYAHYADKEDLLQGSLDGLSTALDADIAARGATREGHPALRFCLPMAEHVGDNRRLHAMFVGGRGSALAQELVRDMWVEFIQAGWPEGDALAVRAIAGAFEAALAWWLAEAPELSAEDMVQRFCRLIEPGLTRD